MAGDAPGEKAPTDAVWFRQTFEVPETLHGYDLTGARIWFQFHADANGPMPEILYFNGRRVAMGDDLEPIVLFDDARPGTRPWLPSSCSQQWTQKSSTAPRCVSSLPRTGPIPTICAQEFLSASVLLPSLAPGDSGTARRRQNGSAINAENRTRRLTTR